MNDRLNRLIELIKGQLRLAYFDAKRCHDKLLSVHNDFENEQRALVFLNRAARHMDLAYSLYQSYQEELEHYSVTPIFPAFDVFYDEVTENIATDHSHQWSDIEFEAVAKRIDVAQRMS